MLIQSFFFLITDLWKNLFISSKVFPFANFCFQCKRSGKLAVISNLDILSTVSGKCPTMSKVHAVQENLLQTIQDINGWLQIMFILTLIDRSSWHKEHGYFGISIFEIEMPNCKTRAHKPSSTRQFLLPFQISSVSVLISDVKIIYSEGSDHKKLSSKKMEIAWGKALYKRKRTRWHLKNKTFSTQTTYY